MSGEYVDNGLKFERHYTKPGENPLETIVMDTRTAEILGEGGEEIFRMEDVEVPQGWSQQATDIVADKYFKKKGVPGRGHEYSVRQLVERVADELSEYGEEHGYFASAEDARTFGDELKAILAGQVASFNSPVWFNVGVNRYGIKGKSVGEGYWRYDHETGNIVETEDTFVNPQGSACFINSIEDDLLGKDGIYDLVTREGRLFKHGSGTGTNFSGVRGEGEALSGGGRSSGLLSFLRINDRAAGAIKSGGTTRRAAKMVILDYDHPDIEEFIEWKSEQEGHARTLVEYGKVPLEKAVEIISGQNGNNSVRVSNEFMEGVESDGTYSTRGRVDPSVEKELKNREIFEKIAMAAHACGDPGLQFDDTINEWHTCPEDGSIDASNPCSEYMFLDDSACNLASINLRKVQNEGGGINLDALDHTTRVMITAQEILVDKSSYPGKKIAENSHKFRPLGLGFANLGALLMTEGLPYDSDDGRAMAAAIMANITGEAYAQSARVASAKGAFEGYERNSEHFLRVMRKHVAAVESIEGVDGLEGLIEGARTAWEEAIRLGEENGYRNAQTTVLAPTGTIAFMMDCDTTGVEPDFALIKGKKMAGGGFKKIVNRSIVPALQNLGYSADQIHDMVSYINAETKRRKRGTIEGAPWLRPEHYPIFDCATPSGSGERFIGHSGHIDMMAAVQPFISGAISKTVNLPNEATSEDIQGIYLDAWRNGLKAVAIYRNGSKITQPLGGLEETFGLDLPKRFGERRNLEKIREGDTHKATISGHDVIVRFGEYPDGSLGEVFVDMHKEGSELRTALHQWAVASSKAIQHGMGVDKFVRTYLHQSDAIGGMVDHPFIHQASSVYDLIARIVGVAYLGRTDLAQNPEEAESFVKNGKKNDNGDNGKNEEVIAKGVCGSCSSTLGTQTGTCWTCLNCGSNEGCG
tara:strand:+ start:17649 stop:20423 length:2775 start_codon:yes stop_codon:yes gene_type:complete